MPILTSMAWSDGPKAIRFKCTAGTLDAEVINCGAVLWQLPDGSTSTATRLSGVSVTAGVVACRAENFATDTGRFTLRSGTAILGDFVFPQRLRNIYITGTYNNTVPANMKFTDLPLYLNELDCSYVNGLVGSTDQLPREMRSFSVRLSSGTITAVVGQVANLPPNLTKLSLGTGTNAVTGTVAQIPKSVIALEIYGSSTYTNISGDLADMPAGMTDMQLYYVRSIGGVLSAIPASCKKVSLYVVGTDRPITGNVANLPVNLTYTYIHGLPQITGSLADTTWGSTATQLYFRSCPGVAGSPPTYPNTIGTFTAAVCGFQPADTDAMLIGLAAAGKTTGTAILTNNRTSASDAALANLTTSPKSWNVSFV